MRKMSFRATGSDAALWIRTRGKSKEIADSGDAPRLLCTYYRRRCISPSSRLSLSLSLSLSLCVCLLDVLYLSAVLSRDSSPERRKIHERRETESKVEELAHGRRSGPSIKTLKITEFLLVFRELCESQARSGTGARWGFVREGNPSCRILTPLYFHYSERHYLRVITSLTRSLNDWRSNGAIEGRPRISAHNRTWPSSLRAECS